MKKLIAVLLCGILLLSATGCNLFSKPSDESTGTESVADTTDTKAPANNNKPNQGEENKTVGTTLALNSSTKGIKILGERYSPSEEQINCDWTCSGIEFILTCEEPTPLVFAVGSDKPCFFRAYVDGAPLKNFSNEDHFEVNGDTTLVTQPVPAGEHVIRFIKVTGHTLARAQIYSVSYNGTISETAPADKDLYIEFLGDSISCGYGVLTQPNDGKYTGQDGSLAYPYMLANALDADYSIVALSGKGVVYGTPSLTTAYPLSSPLREEDKNVLYQFERKADVVVINVETNDVSKGVDPTEFKTAYKNLISTIRQKNGADCKIVCLYNTMKKDSAIGTAIKDLCAELGGEERGIFVFKMDHSGGGHPTATQHEEYFNALKPFVKRACNATVSEATLNVTSSGFGTTVGFADEDWKKK